MIRWAHRTLLGALFCSSLYAQDKNPTPSVRKKNPNQAYISLIALGPVPSRRYQTPKSTDNNPSQSATLLPVSPGAYPPSTLLFQSGSNKASKKPLSRLRVGFNRSPGVQPIPANKTIRLKHDPTRPSGYHSPYLKLPELKSATHSLVFLYPKDLGPTPWLKKPEVDVINLSSKQRVSKNMLICNFSDRTVTFLINQKIRNKLGPRQNTNLTLTEAKRYHQIKASITGESSNLFDTSIRLTEHTLTVLVFYNANPKTNAGKSVGVFKTTVDRISENAQYPPSIKSP